MYPALLRSVVSPPYTRERINTPDGDFLDLDWCQNDNSHLVIICHGLEGNSQRTYVTGMARIFGVNNFDILAWNYRGCSGETNLKPYSYHSGATYDLESVVRHAIVKGYNKISLIGFSLGGNLVLKYLGEETTQKFDEIVSAVVFSVPVDLLSCAIQIHEPSNFLYERRFLNSFHQKVIDKSARFDEVDGSKWKQVKSVFDFDEYYTAPLSGFKDARDYYEKCSSINFIQGIKIPTLVVNALNDPFLGPECFDPTEFEKSSIVNFELPQQGGHCGFPLFGKNGSYWSELKALEFIQVSDGSKTF